MCVGKCRQAEHENDSLLFHFQIFESDIDFSRENIFSVVLHLVYVEMWSEPKLKKDEIR